MLLQLWLARRQPAARSLLPTLDSLSKPADGAGAATATGFHSSDVDVTEVTLKDMNPDDIRVGPVLFIRSKNNNFFQQMIPYTFT